MPPRKSSTASTRTPHPDAGQARVAAARDDQGLGPARLDADAVHEERLSS
jgi:hypothetical protein